MMSTKPSDEERYFVFVYPVLYDSHKLITSKPYSYEFWMEFFIFGYNSNFHHHCALDTETLEKMFSWMKTARIGDLLECRAELRRQFGPEAYLTTLMICVRSPNDNTEGIN